MTHWLVMGYRALCFGATNTNLPWEENAIKVLQWINFCVILIHCPPLHSTLSILTLHTLHTFPGPPFEGLKDPFYD